MMARRRGWIVLVSAASAVFALPPAAQAEVVIYERLAGPRLLALEAGSTTSQRFFAQWFKKVIPTHLRSGMRRENPRAITGVAVEPADGGVTVTWSDITRPLTIVVSADSEARQYQVHVSCECQPQVLQGSAGRGGILRWVDYGPPVIRKCTYDIAVKVRELPLVVLERDGSSSLKLPGAARARKFSAKHSGFARVEVEDSGNLSVMGKSPGEDSFDLSYAIGAHSLTIRLQIVVVHRTAAWDEEVTEGTTKLLVARGKDSDERSLKFTKVAEVKVPLVCEVKLAKDGVLSLAGRKAGQTTAVVVYKVGSRPIEWVRVELRITVKPKS